MLVVQSFRDVSARGGSARRVVEAVGKVANITPYLEADLKQSMGGAEW